MKKYLVLSLALLITQANAFTPARTLLSSFKRLEKYHPLAAHIVGLLREKYSSKEFNKMVQDIVDGELSSLNIEKYYYEHNQNLNKLFIAIETTRRESPRIEQGRELVKKDNNITQQLYSIGQNNTRVRPLLYSIRFHCCSNEEFSEMLSFFIKNEITSEELLNLYEKRNYDSEKLYNALNLLLHVQT